MNKLRQTIINLLDDEYGVNDKSFKGIMSLCEENSWQDILDLVEHEFDYDNDTIRHFLWEADAEILLTAKKIDRAVEDYLDKE